VRKMTTELRDKGRCCAQQGQKGKAGSNHCRLESGVSRREKKKSRG
jgi:hypothetical protein